MPNLDEQIERIIQDAQTLIPARASGGQNGSTISCRRDSDGRTVQARCYGDVPPGPVTLIRMGGQFVAVSGNAARQTGEREAVFRREQQVSGGWAIALYVYINDQYYLTEIGADPEIRDQRDRLYAITPTGTELLKDSGPRRVTLSGTPGESIYQPDLFLEPQRTLYWASTPIAQMMHLYSSNEALGEGDPGLVNQRSTAIAGSREETAEVPINGTRSFSAFGQYERCFSTDDRIRTRSPLEEEADTSEFAGGRGRWLNISPQAQLIQVVNHPLNDTFPPSLSQSNSVMLTSSLLSPTVYEAYNHATGESGYCPAIYWDYREAGYNDDTLARVSNLSEARPLSEWAGIDGSTTSFQLAYDDPNQSTAIRVVGVKAILS